jgi:hypothetical protein
VSRRVAIRARADAARRAARLATGTGAEPEAEAADFERRELLAALEEEVDRLPEPFGAAIVLCDLGGLTHEAAANQLGCPVGTIESRLSRGRKRLRERLVHRGFAPASALAGGLAASVPESLSAATVHNAANAAKVSAAIATLIEGVITEMAWTKLKTITLGLLVAALACGLGVAAERNRPRRPESPKAAVDRARKPIASRDASAVLEGPARMKPGNSILIEVLEALPGRPISGLRYVRPDGTISLGFYGDLKVAGLTRDEIKVKVIERLLKFMPEEVLGLELMDVDGETIRKVAPIDSDRVFVDDSINFEGNTQATDMTAQKLDRILEAVEPLARTGAGGLLNRVDPSAGGTGPRRQTTRVDRDPSVMPEPRTGAPAAPSDLERRLSKIEETLSLLIDVVEELRKEKQ